MSDKHQKTDESALKTQLDTKAKEAQDYLSHLQRLQADFENFIKRTEKEKLDIINLANAKLISKLLVVLDEFDHTILAIKNNASREDLTKGIELLHKNVHKILADEGLTAIDSKGKTADPYQHEVLLTEPKDGVADDIIIDELQKGYRLKDKVLRYAKVKIAKAKQPTN